MSDDLRAYFDHQIRSVVIDQRFTALCSARALRKFAKLWPTACSCSRTALAAMRRGTFELDGGVTSVVEDLTGRPAETSETTGRRYAVRAPNRREPDESIRQLST